MNDSFLRKKKPGIVREWAGIVSRITNYHGFKESKTKTPKQLT